MSRDTAAVGTRGLVLAAAVLCGLGLRPSWAISRPTEIVLEGNEYKHILVAINDNVPYTATLLQSIKDTFTKGSAFLYSATNQRAVFRDVTILVPSSWSGSYPQATTQVFNNADVIFTAPMAPAPPPPPPPGRYADVAPEPGDGSFLGSAWITSDQQQQQQTPAAAATRMYAGCGHPGVRVTLTTDMFTMQIQSRFGPPEKVLVHEWAHFRWGVFDEYALEGEPQFYFSPTTGKLEGIRCTELQQGIIIKPNTGPPVVYCREVNPNTGLYDEGCTFQPYPAGPQTAGVEASIMDRVNVRPIVKFCNDDASNNSTKHNYDAPSRHNRLCGHRSTWDVISSTPDFSNGANPPRAGLSTAPVFTVLQAPRTRRMMLTLDTSASMVENQKLTRMRQAVGTFLSDTADPDTEVGLATFSVDAAVLRAPLPLNTSQARRALVTDLPATNDGATDIASGLTAAAKSLQGSQQTNATHLQSRHPRSLALASLTRHALGGHVVLVTDGQDNSGPSLLSLLPALKGEGVTVTTVVLGGPPSEDLEQLARQTGGQVYCDHNYASSTATMDAFFDILDSSRPGSSLGPVQITSEAMGYYPYQTSRGNFYVDADVGNRTTIYLTYDVAVPVVSVTSPTGRVYSPMYPEYSLDNNLQMAKILIPGNAETGEWSYEIRNANNYQRVALLVLSWPRSDSDKHQLVRLSGSILQPSSSSSSSSSPLSQSAAATATMRIFAEATRGDKPVTGLEVTAHVELPDGTSQEVALYDNGAGADIVAKDGVYSRCFNSLSQPGLYTVRLSAKGPGPRQGGPITVSADSFVQRSVYAGYVVIGQSGNGDHAHVSVRSAAGSEKDNEAPARISDLRVVKTSSENRTVVLTWTAPGDDFDQNSASRYEVYVGPSVTDLMHGTDRVTNLTFKDVVMGSLAAPRPFGSREYLMVRIPSALATTMSRFVFAVLAVDDANNKGAHSNYVTVGLGQRPGRSLMAVPDVTDWAYWVEGQKQLQPSDAPGKTSDSKRLEIALVLGTTSTLLVIVIIVTLAVSAVVEMRKRRALLALSLPSTTVQAQGKRTSPLKKGSRHTVNGSVISLKVYAIS